MQKAIQKKLVEMVQFCFKNQQIFEIRYFIKKIFFYINLKY